jgi:hypothetical protein
MERRTQLALSEVEGSARQPRESNGSTIALLLLHPQPDLDEDDGNFLGYCEQVTGYWGTVSVGGQVAVAEDAALHTAL